MALMLAGCGGDAGKAKGYVNDGDKALVDLKPASDQFSNSVTDLFKGVFEGGKVDPSTFQKDAAAVKAQAEKVVKGAEGAKAEYVKVAALKDVPFYKEYADDQVKIIDLNTKAMGSLNEFLDKWSQSVGSSSFDPVAFVNAARDFSVMADATAVEIEKLEKAASKLKKEKKL